MGSGANALHDQGATPNTRAAPLAAVSPNDARRDPRTRGENVSVRITVSARAHIFSRQRKTRHQSAAVPRFEIQCSTKVFDNGGHDRQAQSAALYIALGCDRVSR